jgi:D-lactate dehydrogenase
LTSFPNVLLTAHQAFFTNEALTQIAKTTFENVFDLITKNNIDNKVALLN